MALERTLFIVKPDATERNLVGRILAHVEDKVCCLERENAVAFLRETIGSTDPAQAADGTIRKLYAKSKGANSVHASDSPASAEREVKLFFGVAALTH